VIKLILLISGSPRKGGNTDVICNMLEEELEKFDRVNVVRICDYNIKPCISCRECVKKGECLIEDDMKKIYPLLFKAKAIVIISPVYFNNVTAQLKTFIDRTWCIRGKLKNKIGAAIVVGRRYGHEMAINAIHSFFLKHEMIIGTRGIVVMGYEKGEAKKDKEGIRDVKKLAKRIAELLERVGKQ